MLATEEFLGKTGAARVGARQPPHAALPAAAYSIPLMPSQNAATCLCHHMEQDGSDALFTIMATLSCRQKARAWWRCPL